MSGVWRGKVEGGRGKQTKGNEGRAEGEDLRESCWTEESMRVWTEAPHSKSHLWTLVCPTADSEQREFRMDGGIGDRRRVVPGLLCCLGWSSTSRNRYQQQLGFLRSTKG